MFGILGTLQRIYNARAQAEGAGWPVGLLQFFKQQWAKRQKEEIRYPNGKDQTCPKELDTPNQQEVV